MRRHIREDLKPGVRQSDSETDAWIATEEILRARVESYPERFSVQQLRVIREFHKLRWGIRHVVVDPEQRKVKLLEFDREHPDPAYDHVFGVISQVFSK